MMTRPKGVWELVIFLPFRWENDFTSFHIAGIWQPVPLEGIIFPEGVAWELNPQPYGN